MARSLRRNRNQRPDLDQLRVNADEHAGFRLISVKARATRGREAVRIPAKDCSHASPTPDARDP